VFRPQSGAKNGVLIRRLDAHPEFLHFKVS
jgi:hypothetical protein